MIGEEIDAISVDVTAVGIEEVMEVVVMVEGTGNQLSNLSSFLIN